MKKSKPKRSVVKKIDQLIKEATIEAMEATIDARDADKYLQDLEEFLSEYKKTGWIPTKWMEDLDIKGTI